MLSNGGPILKKHAKLRVFSLIAPEGSSQTPWRTSNGPRLSRTSQGYLNLWVPMVCRHCSDGTPLTCPKVQSGCITRHFQMRTTFFGWFLFLKSPCLLVKSQFSHDIHSLIRVPFNPIKFHWTSQMLLLRMALLVRYPLPWKSWLSHDCPIKSHEHFREKSHQINIKSPLITIKSPLITIKSPLNHH